MKRTLPLVITFALAASLRAAVAPAGEPVAPSSPASFTLVQGVEYANVRGNSLKVDLRIPDGPGPWPAIVSLHSGGWIMGSREDAPATREALRGYVVASIDYELAPMSVYPAQIEDCKAAVRWLRANAALYRVDPDRIGVVGSSAGGHLAALLGTTGGVAELEGTELGNAGYDSRVRAVVDWYGPIDLLKLDEQKIPCLPLDGDASFMPPSLLIGCPIQSCPDKTNMANPALFITPEDPPTLILQGMLDCLVSYKQSVDFYNALQAAGVTSKLVLLPTAKHSDPQFNEPKYQQVVDDFLDRYLKGVTKKSRAIRR